MLPLFIKQSDDSNDLTLCNSFRTLHQVSLYTNSDPPTMHLFPQGVTRNYHSRDAFPQNLISPLYQESSFILKDWPDHPYTGLIYVVTIIRPYAQSHLYP